MDELESKIYCYVMQHPLCNSVDVAKALGLRSRRVTLVLTRLKEAGAVESQRIRSMTVYSVGSVSGTRVALYARVSTSDQDETLQLPRLQESARLRGYVVMGEFTDEATGKDFNRPGWSSVMDLVRSESIDAVIVTKLDRIVRNLQLLQQELEIFGQYHVQLVTLDMGIIDPVSPAGKLQLQMLGAVAEWERGIISARTREALAVKKSKGVKLGRPSADIPIHRIALLRGSGATWQQIGDIVGIPWRTIYSYKEDIEDRIKEIYKS